MARINLESLLKRLGALDAERRKIFDEIKNSPESVVKMAKNYFDEFIKSNKWFMHTGEKTKKYRRLISYKLLNEKPFLSSVKSRPQLQVELEWLLYEEGSAIVGAKNKQAVTISVFSDLLPQISNGMKVVEMDEKKLKKLMLLSKKQALKAEMDKIDLEMKTLR